MTTPTVKLVVIGEGAVGKTSALITFTTHKFPDEYIPTVMDIDTFSIELDGQSILFNPWDLAGSGDEFYDRLRPLGYVGTDVFMVCYSIHYIGSFHRVETKWVPEIRRVCPNVPIVVCALKADLRIDARYCSPSGTYYRENSSLITSQEGYELAKRIHADAYLEFSSRTQVGLKEAFEHAIRLGVRPRSSPNRKQQKYMQIRKPVPFSMRPVYQSLPLVEGFKRNFNIDRDIYSLLDMRSDSARASVDVVFCYNGLEPIPAHRAILSSTSNYMLYLFFGYGVEAAGPFGSSLPKEQALFDGRQVQCIKVKDEQIPYDHMQSLLRVIYSCDLEKGGKDLLDEITSSFLHSEDRALFEAVAALLGQRNLLLDWCEQKITSQRITKHLISSKHWSLRARLRNVGFADVCLEVNNSKFNASKAILAARCPFFSAMFSGMFNSSECEATTLGNMEKVILEHLDESEQVGFPTLLEFIYSDNIELAEKCPHLLVLIALADRFGMSSFASDLIPLCEYLLCVRMRETNADSTALARITDIAKFAQQFEAKKVLQFASAIIARNYDKLMGDPTLSQKLEIALAECKELRNAVQEWRYPSWYKQALQDYNEYTRTQEELQVNKVCCNIL